MIERFISNIITGHFELHTSQELYYALGTHKLLFLRVFSRLKSRYQQFHLPFGRKRCRCWRIRAGYVRALFKPHAVYN